MSQFVLRLLAVGVLIGMAACSTTQAPAPVVDRSESRTSSVSADKASDKPAEKKASDTVADTKLVAPPVEKVARKGYYLVKANDNLYRISLEVEQDVRDLALWNNLDNPNKILVGQELRVIPPEGEAITKAVILPKAVEQRPIEASVVGDILKKEPKAGREPYSDEAYAAAMKGAIPAVPAKVELKVEVKPEVKPVAKADGDLAWAWPHGGNIMTRFGEKGRKGLEVGGKKGDAVLAAGDGRVVYSGEALRSYGKLLIVKHSPDYLSVYAHNSKILVKENDNVKRGQRIADMGDSEAEQVMLYFEIRQQGKQVDPLKLLPPR